MLMKAMVCAGLGLAACVFTACASRPAGARPADDAAFRRPASIDAKTIFSELDLPTPTTVRTAAGTPGPDYWQQRADYDIDARLDEKEQTLYGRERITYTNNSPQDLPFLWLHLEQNLYRPDSIASRMREAEGRFGNRNPFEGGLKIRAMKADGVDVELRAYDTVGRIDLEKPVAARGGKITLDIEWSFLIPQYGSDRMGIQQVEQGLIYQIAQWFPAMCVFDDVHGWNTLPYLGQGEFYTNYGDYDVKLTVPRNHIVAATGVLQNPREVLTPDQVARLAAALVSEETVVIRSAEEVGRNESRPAGDGPLTWRFVARDVRTFAWTSSAAFIWDASGIAERGKSPADSEPGREPPKGTLVQSVYPKEALPLWSRSTEMLRFSIEHYGKMWYRYPYPVATNANGLCGGMEYPMLIFCSERKDEHGLYGVTTHEIGHNWFPMIVNTDERRHAWMDEGFNTFINYYSNRAFFPDSKGGRGTAADFVDFARQPNQQPVDTPADRIYDGRLGGLEYGKTAAGLVLLREHILGAARFDPAFREYIKAWAFKSPRPSDFYRCIENGAGADLAWFWRGWFLSTGTLDQAVSSVRAGKNGWELDFANRGELVMPLRYRLTYSDRTTEDHDVPVEAWFTRNAFTANLPATPGRTIMHVEVDPDGVFPDVDRANNTWPAIAPK